MIGIESPYAYTPGDSFLHRWSSIGVSHWKLGMLTKVGLFFVLAFATTRLAAWSSLEKAFVAYTIFITGGLIILASVAGIAKVWALVREMNTILVLGVLLGVPTYFVIIYSLHQFGAWDDVSMIRAALTVAMVLAILCCLLIIASIFFSTTPLVSLLRHMKGSVGLKTFLAIVITSLAKLDENMQKRGLAFDSLSGGKDANGRNQSSAPI